MYIKTCNDCGETKATSEFHKRQSKNGDGFQYKCKSCQNKYNEKYRKVIRPKYWNHKDGYFSDSSRWAYIADYTRADKDIKVYLLKIKDHFYVGMTKARLNVRMSVHRGDYNSSRNHGRMPGLHRMWDTMSKEEINKSLESVIVLESKPGTRYEGYKLEKKWILRMKEDGYDLLNDKNFKRQR
tara:strand:- start:999 stop:1547 length:549 start_codon:yes stop_codon:yes gene_type:complete